MSNRANEQPKEIVSMPHDDAEAMWGFMMAAYEYFGRGRSMPSDENDHAEYKRLVYTWTRVMKKGDPSKMIVESVVNGCVSRCGHNDS